MVTADRSANTLVTTLFAEIIGRETGSLPVTVIDTGLPPCHRLCGGRLWRLSSARLAGKELYRAGFAWTHPDKIQNTPCADQGRPDGTDKWRTESAIHVAVIGDPAGQRPFRCAGGNGL
jgi:hypothetical protein